MGYLIIDRDPLYTKDFRVVLRGSGVEPVRLPARGPNLNAHAERFVLSARFEALNRAVPLGERHLRRTVLQFARHHCAGRHHQGLDGRLIEPDETAERTEGRVVCRERLGGFLRYYYREAA